MPIMSVGGTFEISRLGRYEAEEQDDSYAGQKPAHEADE